MLPHHEAWLSARSHRTEEWLRERVKDGFDIHHLDGDHSNNDPANLVLIEHTDHMGLHNGGCFTLGRLGPSRPARRRGLKRATAYRRYEEHKKGLAEYCRSLQENDQ